MKWSVLLLLPDYVATEYGHETYYDFVEAPDPASAIKLAREHAVAAHGGAGAGACDYFVLLATAGYNGDVNPE